MMKRMQKRKWSALALSLLLLLGLLGGCGAKSQSASYSAAVQEKPEESFDMMVGSTEKNGSAAADTTGSSRGEGSAVYRNENAKLIRTANLSLQTMEFDQTLVKLEELVAQVGGYFESASLEGGSYRDVNARRFGDYTIRIPAAAYESFLNQTGELGYVTYRNETTEDIGEQYYDTEARLKTQKTKQERLLELLSKAATMEDIIDLENALSEVEYEIEQLTSTLNRYDSLVGFSTIYLSVNEVYKVSTDTGVTNTLGQRMSKGFASSFSALVEGAQDVLVWFAYNIFGILIAGAVIVLFVVLLRKKKPWSKRKPVQAQKADDSDEQ